jgi:hypothetical protein
MKNKERIGGIVKEFPAQTYQPTADRLKMMLEDPYGNSSLVKQGEGGLKSSQLQAEQKQFQSTYFTLRELKPLLFN